MNTKLLLFFIFCSFTNVVLSATKSICTIKGGKCLAALMNALSYGFGVIMTVYTMSDLPLLVKAAIVGLCNFCGVFIVKLIEEKLRKDQPWKIEITIPKNNTEKFHHSLEEMEISHNFIPNIGPWTLVNCYCPKKADTKKVLSLAKTMDGKAFASTNLI
jgi:hypothetical protein